MVIRDGAIRRGRRGAGVEGHARLVAKRGAAVVLGARRTQRLDELAQGIRDHGGYAITCANCCGRGRPMLADFRADRTGFVDARRVQLPDNQWLDIVTWNSHEDFAASRAKGANLPGISAFFDAIVELVSSEEGTERDGGYR